MSLCQYCHRSPSGNHTLQSTLAEMIEDELFNDDQDSEGVSRLHVRWAILKTLEFLDHQKSWSAGVKFSDLAQCSYCNVAWTPIADKAHVICAACELLNESALPEGWEWKKDPLDSAFTRLIVNGHILHYGQAGGREENVPPGSGAGYRKSHSGERWVWNSNWSEDDHLAETERECREGILGQYRHLQARQ